MIQLFRNICRRSAAKPDASHRQDLLSRRRCAPMLLQILLLVVFSVTMAGSGAVGARDVYYYGEDAMNARIPAITGSFIQPWLCQGWSDEQWDRHLDMLLSAGIHTVIMQWTAETPDGEFSYAGFPVPAGLPQSAGLKTDEKMVERLLKSAEKKNVKVFLGLNTADEWWNQAFLKKDWRKKQAEAGNAVAKILYDAYKSRYPNAFYGWYWVWEMYGNTLGFGRGWVELMNANLDYLTALDDSLPVLFSPFMSGYMRLTPRQEEAMWTGFFARARLRPGDIFCPQDSVGAVGFTMNYVDKRLQAMKKAADTKPGLVFWVNNETFTKLGNDFKPALMDRFISQLYVSDRYTNTHVSFAYSHYYDPEHANPSFDRSYKAFLHTGQVDRTPPAAPALAADVAADRRSVSLTVTPADPADCWKITIYRGNKVIDTYEATQPLPGLRSHRVTDRLERGGVIECSATVTDCWGNVSERATVTCSNK